jgi:hypothetical protein
MAKEDEMARSATSAPRTGRGLLTCVALVALMVSAIVGGEAVVAQDEPVTYAGCIDADGLLVNVAEGMEPAAPCAEGATLARWNAEGPMGPQGEPGPRGEPGPAGVAATYFASVSSAQPFTVSVVARCDEGDRVTGGGFSQSSGPPTWVVESFPSGGRAWTVTLATTTGSMEVIEVEVYAVCADLDPLR